MNATYHLDHLQTLHHMSSDIQAVAPPQATSGNLPSSAKTTHYGPDGKTVASKSTSDYAQVHMSPSGKIQGGDLQHSETDPGGKALSDSQVAFNSSGQAGSVKTQVHSRFGTGVVKKVHTDLSAVNWTASQTVHSGDISVTTQHAASGKTRMAGRVSFADETIQSGVYNHFDSTGDGQIRGQSRVDYSTAKRVGTRIVGGHCGLKFLNNHKQVQSTSDMFMAPQGHVLQINVKNFEVASGALKSTVTAKFDKMQFDARNQFMEGQVELLSASPEGKTLAQTTTEFKASVPHSSTTHCTTTKGAALKVVTDFADAQFNNDLQAVNSDVLTSVYDACGKLISKITVSYDAEGNRKTRKTETFSSKDENPVSVVDIDYSGAALGMDGEVQMGSVTTVTHDLKCNKISTTETHFEPKTGAPVPNAQWQADIAVAAPTGQAPSYSKKYTETKNANGEVVSRTETISRADGTVLQTVVTQVNGKKPVSSLITKFAVDGKTVITTESLDLTNLDYDSGQNKVSGAVSVDSKFRGVTKSGDTQLTF